MRYSLSLGAAALASVAAATATTESRFVMYFDQWHTASLPDKSQTQGINYVITAFANSSLFAAEPAGEYKPFMPLDEVRAMFQDGAKLCMAIGGWGDTVGFGKGCLTEQSRKKYAKNIADTINRLGYDCVDMDWEYPGGNGADYKQIPNSKKIPEIEAYPLLLKEIKAAIGDKELSIAVPGLERDMIAYGAEHCGKINEVVDFVNLMTYDLMNRRDTATTHHSSISGTAKVVETYIERGFTPSKLIVGIPFYSKFFTTKKGYTCDHPVGCPVELLEAADGSDTGKSGAFTFEKANYAPVPTNLKTSSDNTCGAGSLNMCGEVQCCSQYGYCGNTTAHCDTGCQAGYGRCEGIDIKGSFKKAMQNGKYDKSAGGQWFWDSETSLFWTWDTPKIIETKLAKMKSYGVGGIMAWSLAEDSHDWSHLKAMQKSFKSYGAASGKSSGKGSQKPSSNDKKSIPGSGGESSGTGANSGSSAPTYGEPSGPVSGGESSGTGSKPGGSTYGNTGGSSSGTGSGKHGSTGSKHGSTGSKHGSTGSKHGSTGSKHGSTGSKPGGPISGGQSSGTGSKPGGSTYGNTGGSNSGTGSGKPVSPGSKPVSPGSKPGGAGESSGTGAKTGGSAPTYGKPSGSNSGGESSGAGAGKSGDEDCSETKSRRSAHMHLHQRRNL